LWGSHRSCNILDFNTTPGKSWNSPYFKYTPGKTPLKGEFTQNILKTLAYQAGSLDQASSMHSCQNEWLYGHGIPSMMSLFPWIFLWMMPCMENTGMALSAVSRKYGLSLPALLCDVCPHISDVMLCLYLLYRYSISSLSCTHNHICIIWQYLRGYAVMFFVRSISKILNKLSLVTETSKCSNQNDTEWDVVPPNISNYYLGD